MPAIALVPAMRTPLLCASVLLLSAAAAASQTPTVEELIARNTESRGGASRLKEVNTRRVTGTITIQEREAAVEVLAKRPNLMVQEMQMDNQRFVTAFDGQQAWQLNPMFGPKPQVVKGPQADALRDQAQFEGPLAGAFNRGDKIEILGADVVDGTPVWKLQISSGERAITVFLDQTSGLERKVAMSLAREGEQLLIESVISDYHEVDGITIPRRVDTRIGGEMQASMRIESIEFNVPIEDSRFKMPSDPGPVGPK